jgi:hypothetical protein
MGKIGDYFEKYGVTNSDVFKALIYFKTLSVITGLGTLAMCYKYRPLITLFKQPYPKQLLAKIENRYPTQYNRSKQFVIEKSEKLAASKYFKPIPNYLNIDSKRLTIAVAENMVFYKLCIPILMPIQFWLVVHALKKDTLTLPKEVNIQNIKSVIVDSYEVISVDNSISSHNNTSTSTSTRVIDE